MKNGGIFSDLLGQLRELDGAQVVVGVQSTPGENLHGETVSSNSEMMTIASVHEYGCDIEVTPKMRAWLHHNGIHLRKDTTRIHIPERSYIRRGYEDGKASLEHAMNALLGQMFRGEISVDTLLQNLGQQAVTDTVGNMGVDTTPVNTHTMTHRKHSMSSTPLTDTGSLANHITAAIKKGGG